MAAGSHCATAAQLGKTDSPNGRFGALHEMNGRTGATFRAAADGREYALSIASQSCHRTEGVARLTAIQRRMFRYLPLLI
jgi:hypothetical protein